MKKLMTIYNIICMYVGAYVIGKIAGEKIGALIAKLIVKE